MSYLVMHIDLEFIVGTVCADNGTSYLITNGNEDFLWLFFFNNPHQNSISFGKDNKSHFNNSEINYYGKYFDKIEREQESFTLRGIEHPVIDLLKESGLLQIIRKTYQQKTLDNTENIPTLITFSSSIRDSAKQKTVDYFTKNNFRIDSYTIPLSELSTYYALHKNNLKVSNGNLVVFLEATNPNLHLMKLSYSDNYFLLDGKTQTQEGMGFDPRKLALLRFVVNEVNKATGVLSSDFEKIEECKRLEMQADEWLRRLDSQTRNNIPLLIRSVSFARTPNMKNDVMVRKDDLENDTGQYTQDLKDVFDAFKSDSVKGNVAGVFLLGDCFQSDRVKSCFEQIVDKNSLYFYTSKDIRDILSMYPKIDINRYANEEARIKERAKAEEIKLAEQRVLEDRTRIEEEDEKKRLESENQNENKRKEAQKLYDRAIELDKQGKIEDARINAENASTLDKTNREYKQYVFDLSEKISKVKEKNELYKKYLSNADLLVQNGDFEKALEEYDAAKYVFDNADVIKKIIDVNRLIKNREQQNDKVEKIIFDAQTLFDNNDFFSAKEKLRGVLTIENENSKAKSLLLKIEELLNQQEANFQEIVKFANVKFVSANYDEAIKIYHEALSIKPNDKYCNEQLQKINITIKIENEKKVQCEKLLAIANIYYNEKKWKEALCQYEVALNLCPSDKSIKDNIKQCTENLKVQEEEYTQLLSDASISMNKGNLKLALASFEKAIKIKPEDVEIKQKIKKIKIEIGFGQSMEEKAIDPKPMDSKDEGFDFRNKFEPDSKNLTLRQRTQNSRKETNADFLHIDERVSKEKQEDFLNKTNRTKNPFFDTPSKDKSK